jgi:PST family polysaccharide transporter
MHPARAVCDPPPPPAPLLAGGRVLLTAQVARLAIRLVSAATLARLLLPDDYGLFGMVLSVHGLLYMVRDFGTGPAVQQGELTAERFAALCRLGLVGGCGLTVACAALGPGVAWFYDEPRLAVLMAAIGLSFPFAGLAAPLQGRLYREQRIGRAAWAEIAGIGAASAAAIVAAWAGAGVWALVLMAIVNEAITLALLAAGQRGLPPLVASTGGAAWSRLAGFAAQLTVHGVASYFARLCDQVTVGRFASPAALGIYGRGVQLATLPVQSVAAPLTGWLVASLARLRDRPEEYRAFFRTVLNGLNHLVLPFAAVCVVAPEVVVGVFYGHRWLAAAPVLRWLGVGLAVQTWLAAPVWVLLSVGRARRLALWSVATLAVFLVACGLARHAGLETMAAATAGAALLTALGALAVSTRTTPARAGDFVVASACPLLGSAGLAVVLIALRRVLPGDQPGLVLAALAAAGALYAAGVWSAWPRLRAEWRGHFLWHR